MSAGCPFAGYGHAILGSPCVALIPITVRIYIVGAVIGVSIVVGTGVTIVVGTGVTIVVVVVVWCRSNHTAEEAKAKAKPKTDRRANAPAAATMVPTAPMPTAAVAPSSTMPAPSAAVGKGWSRRRCQQCRGRRQRYPTSIHL